MNEIFKDIIGYEGLYQVSNLGRVKSLPKGDGNGNRERFLKYDITFRSSTSYNRVTLSKDGKTKRFQVHRLVAQAFIPNPQQKPFINHIDNNGQNNASTNLEWCTASENMQHSIKQGRQDKVIEASKPATAKARKQRVLTENLQFTGKVFGKLTVLSFYLDTSLSVPRTKFVCKCNCGNVTEKSRTKLLKGSQACVECTYKIRAQTRKSR